MKTATNSTWDRLAGALILTRDEWRRLLHKPDVPAEVRSVAARESGRITAALKHPVSRQRSVTQ